MLSRWPVVMSETRCGLVEKEMEKMFAQRGATSVCDQRRAEWLLFSVGISCVSFSTGPRLDSGVTATVSHLESTRTLPGSVQRFSLRVLNDA